MLSKEVVVRKEGLQYLSLSITKVSQNVNNPKMCFNQVDCPLESHNRCLPLPGSEEELGAHRKPVRFTESDFWAIGSGTINMSIEL